jgi:hypothetical protein
MFRLACAGCTVLTVLTRLTCSHCSVPADLSWRTVLVAWIRMSFLVVLSRQYNHNYPAAVVLPWLFCLDCPLLAILSSLSCPDYPFPAFLSRCLVEAVLTRISCPSCPIPAVLSQLPCSNNVPGLALALLLCCPARTVPTKIGK